MNKNDIPINITYEVIETKIITINKKIKFFDIEKLEKLEKLKSKNNISIIGKAGSGKSILIKNLLLFLNKGIFTQEINHKYICILDQDEQYYDFYKSFLDKPIIYDKYDSSIIISLIQEKLGKIRKIRNLSDLNLESKNLTISLKTFLIIDDLYLNKEILNDIKFLLSCTHKFCDNFNFIFTQQGYNKLTNEHICNLDYIFIFKGLINNDLENLLEYKFKDYKNEFRQIYKDISEFKCLVIDNKSQSKNIEDFLFWYKVDML